MLSGCNLEDTDHSAGGPGLRPAAQQAERLGALRQAARSLGVDVVVNARVDVFLQQSAETEERVELALERAGAYRQAGADCVYPIGATEDELAGFVAGHGGPVNAMARSGQVGISRLRSLGVARISFGSAIHRRIAGDLRRLLEAIARSDDEWAAS